MDAKKFLQMYRENALEIERLSIELEKWEERAEYGIEVSDILDILKRRAEEAAAQRAEVERMVSTFEDPKLRMVIALRYLQGLKWEEIEDAMRLEYRWLLRLHRRALAQLEAE